MGTNYYVVSKHCDKCDRYDTDYHIGKSSWGWAFTFQGYPYEKLTSWKLWKEYLKDKEIRDEYGERVTYSDFVDMIESVKKPAAKLPTGYVNKNHNEEGKKSGWFDPNFDWDDDEGYSFSRREFS